MQGPNYWSVRRHNLTVMVLDLEELEEFPTNKIDGFGERLKAMFPSMYSHRCSVGCEGGFFQRVDDGTWMGHGWSMDGAWMGHGREYIFCIAPSLIHQKSTNSHG